MQFEAQTGNGDSVPVTVTAVTDESITVDDNHPLAGKNLNFDVSIENVRDATAEEIDHGHVHDDAGHTHWSKLYLGRPDPVIESQIQCKVIAVIVM